MKMKLTGLIAGSAMLMLGAAVQAQATTYTYADNWVNWPGYDTWTNDESGTPKIDHMDVSINDATGTLDNVSIFLHDSYDRQQFDSLFISTDGAWNSWDYFVHDGGDRHADDANGDVPTDGLYTVDTNYTYTTAVSPHRVDNPNGIDNDSLTIIDSTFEGVREIIGTPDPLNTGELVAKIVYDFSALSIDINSDNFFVAYSPWCGNDVIGGGTAPVPEPATMLLFGTGLVGLASIRRKKYNVTD